MSELSQVNSKIELTIKDIKDILNHWNLVIASEVITPKEGGSYKYEIIFKLADFLEDFIFIGRVVYYLRNRPYKLVFNTFLCHHDYTPVCVKSPNTRYLIKRHVLKLNSLLRFGSFSVDNAGIIKFHLLWNYETNAHLAMKSKQDIEKWMKISLATTMSTLKVNMTKLLMMTELISQFKYDNIISQQADSIRKLPQFFTDDQEKLKRYILDGVKNKIGTEKVAVTVEELPKYPYPFYQYVKVENMEYNGRLTAGGYASIHVVKAKMTLTENNVKVTKEKYYLVKVPKRPANSKMEDKDYVLEIFMGKINQQDNRINIERRVLSYPEKKHFQHIARYYDEENSQKPMLFMENYMPQNLHEFNARKELGMGTKLSWLYQLAHVLSYFEKNGIVHVDLKPSNIVVAKNFFLKVIDFAESLLKKDKTFKNEKRATTMPFSAPETLDESPDNINYESDVFSFAHIAYELIGGKLMIGFKRSSENKLRGKYKKKAFKFLPIQDWLNHLGPQYLMQYIYYIVMLCSTPDQTCRFPQDILVGLIKDYALLVEKLF